MVDTALFLQSPDLTFVIDLVCYAFIEVDSHGHKWLQFLDIIAHWRRCYDDQMETGLVFVFIIHSIDTFYSYRIGNCPCDSNFVFLFHNSYLSIFSYVIFLPSLALFGNSLG
ncbi:hypothetical protein D3C87_1128930 [compost metagenome]